VVTVVDLSEAQLERDRAAAVRYAVAIDAIQGDMRDLSRLEPGAFDLVWQPYSLNFVPDAPTVFGEVARVLRPGGLYHLQCANPFVHGLTTADWDGEGYALKRPYLNGAAVGYDDEAWVYRQAEPAGEAIPGPREYRHTLSTVINGLIARGFVIRRVSDSWSMSPDPAAPPATWAHLVAYAPPWLAFWAVLAPATAGTDAR
jgi:ubiquinone/menaquinone biosynthesis C-methylase UbiE